MWTFWTTELTTMRPSQLRFTVRWLIFAASVIAMDVAAINWVVEARSYSLGGMGNGDVAYNTMYDETLVKVVSNNLTGKTISTTVIRPATTAGLCRVWWPAAASGLLTLLAAAIAFTRTGQWFIANLRLPQMTTRRWMIAVAVLATEAGLVIGTFRNSGVNLLLTQWTPILISLVSLHALAFMPVGVALLYRYVRRRRFRDDTEKLVDRL
jgi:hypothetical protein